MVVLITPILENPLLNFHQLRDAAGFRKFAFGVSKSQITPDINDENNSLEKLWLRTQENYSLNSQMSRNIINLFITSTRQNFYEAHRAMTSGDQIYAADQVAEAAIRMRSLFKDVPPDDPSVAMAVRAAFGVSLQDSKFIFLVQESLERLQAGIKIDEYYKRLLGAWLNKTKE